MVNFLYDYFHQEKFLVSLSSVSDNICEDDDKKYIDFDKFKEPQNCCNLTKGMNSLSSVDSLLINKDKNHIIFVEFKYMEDLKDLKDVKEWFKNKECSIKIKIPDSILLLGYFLKENGYSFNDFIKMKKSFFYVYKNKSFKNTINNHLKGRFNKYDFLLENTKIIEAQAYRNKFLKEQI
ncbi:MAG: hypothetical protein KN64_09350 [Sulfurovum sp. AS07-7]|nr:MAG: hypothetical protein KN64_09350 [Sulfurovum sp. AS07-7]